MSADNNVVQIAVTITEDVPCEPGQPEICGDDIDQDCDDTPDHYDAAVAATSAAS